MVLRYRNNDNVTDLKRIVDRRVPVAPNSEIVSLSHLPHKLIRISLRREDKQRKLNAADAVKVTEQNTDSAQKERGARGLFLILIVSASLRDHFHRSSLIVNLKAKGVFYQ